MRKGSWVATLVLAAIATVCVRLPACAQDYPTKSIKMIVPFPPGGATDFWARLFAAKLRDRWGQPVVVENRAGAGGNVGSEMVARAEPDGYTLLATAPGPLAINRYLYDKLGFDPEAFTPVAVLYANVSALSAHPKSEVRSVQDLVRLAKANPERFNYGSAGIGTTQHLAFEMLKLKAGINATHIPYGGNAPALTDLLSGQIEMMFVELGTALPHYAAGTLRPLAVGSARRAPMLPDVPTISEAVPGVVTDSWMAVAGPPGMPMPIARKLNGAFEEMLKEPDVVAKLRELVTLPVGGSPEDMTTLVKEDSARWGEIVRATKMRAN